MLGYVLIILGIILALFLGVMVHAGFFYTLRIRTTVPYSIPSRVAYKLYKGSYKNAGTGLNAIKPLAPLLTTFGIYYDDPSKVPHPQLRYIVGCSLPDSPGVPEVEERLKSNGYSIWTFPKCTKAIVTEFPFRSILSIYVAPFCVYPALSKYAKKQSLGCPGPIIEVYETDCIRYFAPLNDSDGYFVPEVAKETEAKKEL